MNWQPIETAPKDGTRMLGAWNGYVNICYFDDTFAADSGWYTDLSVEWGDTVGAPLYWMPLPEPPK